MAVFVLLERISPGLTNQNTFNSVHAMNYEIIVLLCCWLEVIKWMQQSIPAKVLPIKSCGGFFLGDTGVNLVVLIFLKTYVCKHKSKQGIPIVTLYSYWSILVGKIWLMFFSFSLTLEQFCLLKRSIQGWCFWISIIS